MLIDEGGAGRRGPGESLRVTQPWQAYRAWLAEDGAVLADAAGEDPSAPVPSCPEWTLAGLIGHVGSYHRWVARLLADRAQEPRRPVDAAPAAGESLADWYRESLALLLGQLDATDPATPMWTVTLGQRAAAWCGRQSHDTAIHRWDAENGVFTAAPVNAAKATELIEELFTRALPYTLPFLGRAVPEASLALSVADGNHDWLIDQEDGRPRFSLLAGAGTVRDGDVGRADATLAGSPSDLLLALWRRPTGALLTGDPAALAAWQTAIDG